MGRKKKIPEKEYPKVVKLHDEDMSIAQIARKYKVTTVTIKNVLKRSGVVPKPQSAGRPVENPQQQVNDETGLPVVIAKTNYNTDGSLSNLKPFNPKAGRQQRDKFLETISKFGFDADTLDVLLPADIAFKASEKEHFYKIVEVYLRDFENEELSSSDVDDVTGLACAKIVELRLLASSKGNDLDYTNVVNAIEKVHKRTEKLKESLSSRRSDRIDVKKKGNISIVDLAAMYDEAAEVKMAERIRKLEDDNVESVKVLGKYRHEDV